MDTKKTDKINDITTLARAVKVSNFDKFIGRCAINGYSVEKRINKKDSNIIYLFVNYYGNYYKDAGYRQLTKDEYLDLVDNDFEGANLTNYMLSCMNNYDPYTQKGFCWKSANDE